MKYFKIIIYLILSLFLVACSSNTNQNNIDDYAFTIIEENKIYAFDENFELLQEVKRNNKNKVFREYFIDSKDKVIYKTLPDRKGISIVNVIEKDSLIETPIQLEENDAYTLFMDDDLIYATAVFGNRIDFFSYNIQGELISSQTIPNGDTINCPQQMVKIDGYLYLLLTEVETSSGIPLCEIWKLDTEFNLIETINLQESSAYMHMINIGHILYITEARSGTNEYYEPVSGNKVLVYNLDNGSKDYIYVSPFTPFHIKYDEKNQKLLIQNMTVNEDGEYTFTIIDINTYDDTLITLGHPNEMPTVVIHDGIYYFLFNQELIEYNPINASYERIDLSRFNIKEADGLIINTKALH